MNKEDMNLDNIYTIEAVEARQESVQHPSKFDAVWHSIESGTFPLPAPNHHFDGEGLDEGPLYLLAMDMIVLMVDPDFHDAKETLLISLNYVHLGDVDAYLAYARGIAKAKLEDLEDLARGNSETMSIQRYEEAVTRYRDIVAILDCASVKVDFDQCA